MTQPNKIYRHNDEHLYAKIDHYLQNGGHQRLQRLFNLPEHVYYNPFLFLSRDNVPHRTSWSQSSGHRSQIFDEQVDQMQRPSVLSDIDLVRQMGLHVPGIDPEPVIRESEPDPCENVVSHFKAGGSKSSFDVSISSTYSVPPGVTESIKLAAEHWGDRFISDVVTRICIEWKSLDGEFLASAISEHFIRGSSFEKLRDDSDYQPALAASLVGEDVLNSTSPHIRIRLNMDMPWHLSISSGALSNEYDLSTIVLHELTHGLFFSGAIVTTGTNRAKFEDGAKSRFDQFIEVEEDIAVAENCVDTDLYNAIRSPNLRFHSPDNKIKMGLFAPRQYVRGSSTYHFNNFTFQEDCRYNKISVLDCSDLMTHELGQGYTRRFVGDATMRVYDAVRSSSAGHTKKQDCAVPDYTEDDVSSKNFVLPLWNISFVVTATITGIALVLGVVVSTIVTRG